MKNPKIQNLRSLREAMKAVARGNRPAPADAGKPSFNSVEAVVRLLTPDNRRLLAMIRDRDSVRQNTVDKTRQQQLQQEIAALEGRLTRCRQALTRIERLIERRENGSDAR